MRHHCPSRINAGSRRNISSSPGIAACKMEGTATISQRRAAESGNSPKTRRLFNHTSISATEAATTAKIDRKSVVEGKSVSVRVDLGGRRIIKNKKKD